MIQNNYQVFILYLISNHHSFHNNHKIHVSTHFNFEDENNKTKIKDFQLTPFFSESFKFKIK